MIVKKRSDLAKTFVLTSWREFPAMNTSVGTMLHNRTGSWRYLKPVYEDKTPPCQNACPAGNDIEGWIKLLQKGEYERAYWHLKREQPFPAILGRVCFTFCEPACNHLLLDQSVSIRELERFLGDQVPLTIPHPEVPEPNGKNLAVVGSGPAGMSAAYYGRLLGFEVTLMEALPVLGGILRVGIPGYRLPKDILDAEFEGLRNMGILLQPNTPVGHGRTLEELGDAFDYIFLATGVHESLPLNLKDEKSCGDIMSGLTMLKKVAMGEDIALGKNTVVIGGGNTAIDAARTALRMGSDVTVIYRRSLVEMPAHPQEVQEAQDEGVSLRFLAAPERIEVNGRGKLTKLICSEMALGPPDESGRRRPVKKEGGLFEVPADSILTAIGERADFSYLKNLLRTEEGILPVGEDLEITGITLGKARVFAGGDIIAIPHTVVNAVAAGKHAAIAMDCHRKGVEFATIREQIAVGNATALSFATYRGWDPVNPIRRNLREIVGTDKIVLDYFSKVPRTAVDIRKASLRKDSFDPYTKSFTHEEAIKEAERCLHCGRCTECDNCLIFCPDMSILCNEKGGFGYVFDYDYCKGCGVCFSECPRHAISMIEEETPVPEVSH